MDIKELEREKYRKQMHIQKRTKLLAQIQKAINTTRQNSFMWFVTVVLHDMKDYLLEEERHEE